MLREVLRIVGWAIFSVLLVLLVPSSAWSDDTGLPPSSPSSSPSDGSPTPSMEPEPSPTDAPESSSGPSPTAEPTPSEGEGSPPPPAPTVTETVTATPEPVVMEMSGTPEDPTVVRLDDESQAVYLLIGCLLVTCTAASLVTAFRS